MKNNIGIYTQNGRILNSEDFSAYAITYPPDKSDYAIAYPPDTDDSYQAAMKQQTFERTGHPPPDFLFHISIIACANDKAQNVVIYEFIGEDKEQLRNKALKSLSSLIEAIDRGKNWTYEEVSDESASPPKTK